MNRIMSTAALVVALAAFGVLGACASDSIGDTDTGTSELATIRAALSISGARYDVAQIHFKVVPGADDCSAEPVDEAIVVLESEPLPPWMDLEGAMGTNHAFSDAFFVVQPGVYKVCATPLNDLGELSMQCEPAEGFFDVGVGETAEAVLMSQCYGEPTGGLDAVLALNVPPSIDDLVISDSKFTSTCELTTLEVMASDDNGDPMMYGWSVLGAPIGANAEVDGYGPTAWFRSDSPGDYLLEVIVADPHGAYGQLLFPLHLQKEELEFTLTHGGTSMPIGVVSGVEDVSTFYSYDSPAVYSANTGMELEDSALAFIYYDTDRDEYSLVLIHDTPGDTEGGIVELEINGLETASALVVTDDPNDSYDMAAGLFVWHWAPCCTDGLAIEFEDRYLCTTLTTTYAKGVDAWTIVWEEDGGFAYADVPLGEPFTLCSCLGGEPFPPVP